MTRNTILLLLLLFALAGAVPCLEAQPVLSPEHQRIDFLIGEWDTVSRTPDGTVRHGRLAYRWVLGGAWMRVEFVGDVPDGVVWEAHVMQRWNPAAGEYEAWVFAGDGPPIQFRGRSDGPGHLGIHATSADGSISGIDYHGRTDGTVYQENWAVRDGVRQITLTTTYQRVEGR
jgi:hypothetical protein